MTPLTHFNKSKAFSNSHLAIFLVAVFTLMGLETPALASVTWATRDDGGTALTITEGSVLSSSNPSFWRYAGTITVQGAGSKWLVEDEFYFSSNHNADFPSSVMAVVESGELHISKRLVFSGVPLVCLKTDFSDTEIETLITADELAALEAQFPDLGKTTEPTGNLYVGDKPSTPVASNTVYLGNGGLLWGEGIVLANVLIDQGATFRPTNVYGKGFDVWDLKLNPGGTLDFNASYFWTSDIPMVNVRGNTQLHGEVYCQFREDDLVSLAGSGQPVPLLTYQGSVDLTGATLPCDPWITSKFEVDTDAKTVSMVFGLPGDGSSGSTDQLNTEYIAGFVGFHEDETASLTIQGNNASWGDGAYLVSETLTEPGDLYLGDGGSAVVTISGKTIETRYASLARGSGSFARVTLDGPDACWHIVGKDLPSTREKENSLFLAHRGRGEIVVQNGASLHTAGKILVDGYYDDEATAFITVNGTGSQLTAGSLVLDGEDAKILLKIVKGATAQINNFDIDSRSYHTFPETTIQVRNADSLLKCIGLFKVENDGMHNISVTEGGRMEIGSLDIDLYKWIESPAPCASIVADGASSEIVIENRVTIEGLTTITARNGGRIWGGTSWVCDGTTLDVSENGGMDLGAEASADVEDGTVRIRKEAHIGFAETEIIGDLTLDSDVVMGLGTAPGGILYSNPSLHITGDAKLSGTICVNQWFSDLTYILDTIKGNSYEIIQVDGYCDWTDATITGAMPFSSTGLASVLQGTEPIILYISVDDYAGFLENNFSNPAEYAFPDSVYFTMHEHGLTMTVVPEPSVMALLFGLAAMLLVVAKRRF